MLAFLVFTIEILVSYLLQSTVFSALSIANTVPDLLLIVAVAAGYQNSRLRGMTVGFFCGLIIVKYRKSPMMTTQPISMA